MVRSYRRQFSLALLGVDRTADNVNQSSSFASIHRIEAATEYAGERKENVQADCPLQGDFLS